MQEGAAALDRVGVVRRGHRRRRRAGVPGRRLRAARRGAADRRRARSSARWSPAHRARIRARQPTAPTASEMPGIARHGGRRRLPAHDALAALDTGLYIGNLWYLNFSDRPACRDDRHDALRDVLGRRRQDRRAGQRLRFDDSVYRMLGEQPGRLTSETRAASSASDSYRARSVGSMRLPGAVVSEMAFTLCSASSRGCRGDCATRRRASPSGSTPAASACTAAADAR